MVEAVSPTPQAPAVEEVVSDVGNLSQWTLIRMRFVRNKLAMFGLFGLIFMYLLVFLGPFIAPNEYTFQNSDYIFGGPSEFTFIGPDGQLGLTLYTYATTSVLEENTFKF